MTARTSQVKSIAQARPARIGNADLDIGERAIHATGTLATFRAGYGMREFADDGTLAIDARAAKALGVGVGDEVWSVAR
jgi:arginine N-succinyltransferase